MDLFKSKKLIGDHLVKLTSELISFPSHVQEPLKIYELIKYVKAYFEGDPLTIIEESINGLPALIITTEQTKHPHILLSGHIDIVTANAPYTARVEEGKLYGTGAMDMKGGVACMMAILKYFSGATQIPSLGLMLTSDEEVGGNGTRTLLEHGYTTDFCIVGEGRHKYDIVIREKGLLVVKLRLSGNALHSAYPWKVINVLEELMSMCLAIKEKFPKPRDAWTPTISITSLHGGRDLNTIPAEAEAIISCRLTGGQRWDRESILKMIKKYSRDADIQEMVYGEVFKMDKEDHYLKLLKMTAQEVTSKRISFGQNHGASDARHFRLKNIPTAILGPVGNYHHSPDEFVYVDSLTEHFEVLRHFIETEQKNIPLNSGT